jgi:hypothetical protein
MIISGIHFWFVIIKMFPVLKKALLLLPQRRISEDKNTLSLLLNIIEIKT